MENSIFLSEGIQNNPPGFAHFDMCQKEPQDGQNNNDSLANSDTLTPEVDPWDLMLAVPASPLALKTVRDMGRQFCQFAGVKKELIHLIVLAVDEACSNIIRHCYKGKEGMIRVFWEKKGDEIHIRLQDFGPESSIENMKPRDLDLIKPGGLGLNFIHSIMDQVLYDYSENRGNELTLIRRIA